MPAQQNPWGSGGELPTITWIATILAGTGRAIARRESLSERREWWVGKGGIYDYDWQWNKRIKAQRQGTA